MTQFLCVSKNKLVRQSAHYLGKFAEYIIYQFYEIVLVLMPGMRSDYPSLWLSVIAFVHHLLVFLTIYCFFRRSSYEQIKCTILVTCYIPFTCRTPYQQFWEHLRSVSNISYFFTCWVVSTSPLTQFERIYCMYKYVRIGV